MEPPEGIERFEQLERLERASILLERLEPDYKTGHSKFQNLTLEAYLQHGLVHGLRDIVVDKSPQCVALRL